MLGLAIKINPLKTKTSIIGYEFETTQRSPTIAPFLY